MKRDIILIRESDLAKVFLVQTEALKGIYLSIISFSWFQKRPSLHLLSYKPWEVRRVVRGKAEGKAMGEEKSPQLGACLWMCLWICILLLSLGAWHNMTTYIFNILCSQRYSPAFRLICLPTQLPTPNNSRQMAGNAAH